MFDIFDYMTSNAPKSFQLQRQREEPDEALTPIDLTQIQRQTHHDKGDQHEQLHDGFYLRSSTFFQGLAGIQRDA